MLEEEIYVHRQGAMGDIIMTLPCLPELKKRSKKLKYYTSKGTKDQLENLLLNFVDEVVSTEVEMAPWGHKNFINFLGYKKPYPLPRNDHFTKDFSEEAGVDFTLELPELPLPPSPFNDKDVNITIQRSAGWSVYKEYNQWDEVIRLCKKAQLNYKFFQIGGPHDNLLKNIDESFLGKSFDENLAAQANAALHLGVDSVFNHASNLRWCNKGKTRSIIIFSSTSPLTSGYLYNTNLKSNLNCQPCYRENPEAGDGSLAPTNKCPFLKEEVAPCIDKITPTLIVENIKLLLNV